VGAVSSGWVSVGGKRSIQRQR